MWCVLQVKGNNELKVLEQLKQKGYHSLVPRENRLIHTKGAWIQKEYLLFPNYVFIATDYHAEDFYKISNIAGVQKFLGDKRSPSSLSFIEEEWIKLLSNNNVPLEPTAVQVTEDGGIELLKGVLLNFKSRIKSFNKRQRKAVFEITVCNEIKEITLSIDVIEDKQTRKPMEVSG